MARVSTTQWCVLGAGVPSLRRDEFRIHGLRALPDRRQIRVKDPKASLAFYQDHFKMQLVNVGRHPEAKFDVYFLSSVPDGTCLPEAGTPEAHRSLQAGEMTALELCVGGTLGRVPPLRYARWRAASWPGGVVRTPSTAESATASAPPHLDPGQDAQLRDRDRRRLCVQQRQRRAAPRLWARRVHRRRHRGVLRGTRECWRQVQEAPGGRRDEEHRVCVGS